MTANVEQLLSQDLRSLTWEELSALIRGLEVVERRIAGLRARVLDAAESDGRWASDGSRSFPAWVRRHTQVSPVRAAAETRLARSLRDHLPTTARALADGRIGAEHAGIIAKHAVSTPERVAALSHDEVGETFLVENAEVMDAGDFNRLVRRWAVAADPAAGDKDWANDLDREHLVLAKVMDGYHLQGWLTDANGAALDAALRARAGVPQAGDARSAAQRRAAALNGLVRVVLDSGELSPGAAIRPHVSVHVGYDTLLRLVAAQAPASHGASAVGEVHEGSSGSTREVSGAAARRRGAGGDEVAISANIDPAALVGATPAELDDGTPISPALLSRLACDSELARVIFGPAGEILDSGRAKRLFTPGQRRAIIARDRRCQYPGCDAPPREGEIHHSIWWYAQYGQTRAQDGVLLCWFHHDHVHANAISIERVPDAGPVQRWRFRRRSGAEIGARRERPGSDRRDESFGSDTRPLAAQPSTRRHESRAPASSNSSGTGDSP